MDEKRAARIRQLQHVPAFAELAEELKDAEDRYWKLHIANLKAGAPLDQREIDFMRGKFDAIRTILAQPDRAARIMDKPKEPTQDGT